MGINSACALKANPLEQRLSKYGPCAVSVSSENLLEMQILMPYQISRMGLSQLCGASVNSAGESDVCSFGGPLLRGWVVD